MQRIHHAVQVLVVVVLLVKTPLAQEMTRIDRERAVDMLLVIGDEVRKHYYDPQFHGLKWDAVIEEEKAKIEKAPTMNLALSKIAGALEKLDDSHTFFLPPQHVARPSYGFQYQMIGDRCFITRVRPKSDAQAKGLKPGDEIVGLNGYPVTRKDLWKMQYVYSVLRPQAEMHLALQDPSGAPRDLAVATKVRQGKFHEDYTQGGDIWDVIQESENQEHLMRARYAEYGDALLVLKVPEFRFTQHEVDGMIDKARAHQNLIVDLRGNPGGAVDTLKYMLGGVFTNEVKIADRVGRKESKPQVSRKMRNPFTGKIVVLVDFNSASAAELFARVVQLEKRGSVLGDRSAGAVMEARHYNEQWGVGTVVLYGASITDADLIMSDGKSLEHTGVIPDEIVLPTAQDLAAGRDPVLARAAELLGVKLSPEEAGKAFPYEWPPEE
jgi:C-terminal processing protease CtpA/Prc